MDNTKPKSSGWRRFLLIFFAITIILSLLTVACAPAAQDPQQAMVLAKKPIVEDLAAPAEAGIGSSPVSVSVQSGSSKTG